MNPKLLFVCTGNAQRSPTFEEWFQRHRPNNYNVRSAGTDQLAPCQISKELLIWADKIYCMDLEQEKVIVRKFPDHLHKIEVIGVNDDYPRNSPQLINLIEYWVKKKRL